MEIDDKARRELILNSLKKQRYPRKQRKPYELYNSLSRKKKVEFKREGQAFNDYMGFTIAKQDETVETKGLAYQIDGEPPVISG